MQFSPVVEGSAMTTNRSSEYTDLSTSMHIAAPGTKGPAPPAYGLRFGLAAVVLSLFGVTDGQWSEPVTEQAEVRQDITDPELAPRAARTTEWDEWKPMRDVS